MRATSIIAFSLCLLFIPVRAQVTPTINYVVSFPDPSTHAYHVELRTKGWELDTLVLKMPRWTPGYYQMMEYAKGVKNFSVHDEEGSIVRFEIEKGSNFRISGVRGKRLVIRYDIKTERQFVASSFVDKDRAYVIPAASFFYVDGFLGIPVHIEIIPKPWRNIATGLDPGAKLHQFTAPDFDILFDCPILVGDLEELPSFKVKGIPHRFVGFKLGVFDRAKFMDNLKRVTEAAVEIIGHIPYQHYTYIAIGPGRGGIEHLNNTTVSFDGTDINSPEGMNRMMNFLAHEYFHHYNVKRIRPFELGPFDYDKGSKTNLLWISEGLTVYYEYLVVKRAGLVDERTLFRFLEGNINNHENNPGRFHQSLMQASYNTWKDGPFGTQGEDVGKSISYYEKGPIVGLLLDFMIRHETQNKKSLDDVMRLLYWRYYQEKGRGFTDAEFQQSCEEIAGVSLSHFFEFVYTTRALDYRQYLGLAGLTLEEETDNNQKKRLSIKHVENPTALQAAILKSWLGE